MHADLAIKAMDIYDDTGDTLGSYDCEAMCHYCMMRVERLDEQ